MDSKLKCVFVMPENSVANGGASSTSNIDNNKTDFHVSNANVQATKPNSSPKVVSFKRRRPKAADDKDSKCSQLKQILSFCTT